MGETIRLLILDIRWPPETFLMRKIEALASCGYRITVGTPDEAQTGIPRNVKVMALPASRRGWLKALCLFSRALLRQPGQAVLGLKQAATGGSAGWRLGVRRWLIAAERPQIVHWEWTLSAAACLPLLEESRRWHAVASCRGAHISIAPLNPRRAEETRRLKDVFALCSRVHGVSEAILLEAEKLGLDRAKAVVIRPAVDPSRFPAKDTRTEGTRVRILMTGALIWRKAMEHALLAFRRVLNSGVVAELEILGGASKAEKERLLYTIDDLGLKGMVHWSGAIPADEVADRLGKSDIFFHASHSEGISNAVLEAMACGLPVVCTDAGGMREAVRDGIDGFVVPVRDVDAMAEALVKLARDPELRRRMGTAARQRVLEKFTLERQTREWRALYEGLLKESRP